MDKDLYRYAFDHAQIAGGRYLWSGFAVLLFIAAIGIASIVETSNSYRAQEGWVVLLDGSQSMGDSIDTGGSKFDRAKTIAREIIANANPRPVALILYSTDSYLISPFTTEYDSISTDLNALTLDMTPLGGTRPDRAIEAALPLGSRAGINRQRTIIVSDGVGSAEAMADPNASIDMVLIAPRLSEEQSGWIDSIHANVVDSDAVEDEFIATLKRGVDVGAAFLGPHQQLIDKSHYIILMALGWLAWIFLRE